MDNSNVTGKELKTWRVESGYSQSQLARALGVITLTVSRWEREDRDIPPFLHLALQSLPKKGGGIKRGRPALKDGTTKTNMKKERKVRK